MSYSKVIVTYNNVCYIYLSLSNTIINHFKAFFCQIAIVLTPQAHNMTVITVTL